ncbi:PilZ domain-containing protein [Methylobacterium phyllosphaerae]
MDQDRRERLRSTTKLPAQIVAEKGQRITCTVGDCSDSGALIKVTSALSLPDAFTLVIGHHGEIQDVRVAWRKTDRLGVTFV